MVKPRKLSSGKWNCRIFTHTDPDGKRCYHSITADTKAECLELAKIYSDKIAEADKRSFSNTVGDAITKYISLCDVLSPTTVHAYKRIQEYAFRSIMDLNVAELTDDVMQAAINQEAKRKNERTGERISAKTVKNEYGLLSSALRTVCGKSFNVRLPKIQRNVQDLPEPELVMSAIIGTDIELPCLLAMWMSLRLSEIRGLMCSSIRNGYLYVDSVVVDVGSKATRKNDAKTASSKRRLKVPPYIMDLIKQTDSYAAYKKTGVDAALVPYSRAYIYYHFTKAMEAKGIEMSFHDLRHEFASISLNILNLPSKSVQASGGWSTPYVMDNCYSQTFEKMQNEADLMRENYFKNFLGGTNVAQRPAKPCKC